MTVTVQVEPCAMVAPEKEIELPPAVATIVPPEQVDAAAEGEENTRPEGSVSVKLTLVSATVFEVGLTSVKVTVEFAPAATEVGLEVSENVGAPTRWCNPCQCRWRCFSRRRR